MKLVVQRCSHSRVSVQNKTINEIGHGLMLLLCFEEGDSSETLQRAVTKILKLRVFDDNEGKINLNVQEVGGEILCISQFTLSWDGSGGNRPSFDRSMKPAAARLMYEEFCRALRAVVPTKKGVFGALMDIEIINNGPVTFSLNF